MTQNLKNRSVNRSLPCSCDSFPILASLQKAALLAVAGMTFTAEAGEVAAFAKVYSWPDGVNNFNNYTKATGGTVNPSASGNGWKSYASASFHSLAASGSTSLPGTGTAGRGYVGGSAYWFEQITISSPTVPAGTIGVADFTLFFEGDVSASSERSDRENKSSISYRWSAAGDSADNVADPNTGDIYEQIVYAALGYYDSWGENFRNQPRNHQATFRFGQPFDFTIAVHCQGEAFRDTVSKVRAELRCTGWNGFRNVQIRYGALVTDATITSQTSFNYANAGSTSFAQWRSLYQLNAASSQVDSNDNGLPNILEYALGRNPIDPDSRPPTTLSTINSGGLDYQSITFTRPSLGARPGDIVYLPERSNGLSGWATTNLETTVVPSTTDTETVTARSTQPRTSQTSEFLRLGVSGP